MEQARIAVQLVGRTLVNERAITENDNPVRHLRQLLGGMLDHDHRDRALATQALDHFKDLVLANWIELRSWLVQDQDVWLEDERIGDGQALFLATRQTVCVGVLVAAQPYLLQVAREGGANSDGIAPQVLWSER